jgi:hypothetical protein
MRNNGARAGTSLVEVLAVMTLTGLLLTLVVGVCRAQLRLVRATAERAVRSDAVRTAGVVLAGEARRMTRADVRALSDDSIAVRAFRGTGIPCGAWAGGIVVRYAGDRLPDPAKDSVLVIGTALTSALVLLDSRPATASCPALAGENVLQWRLSGSAPAASVILVFESGSYHLTDRALRYRIGAAGRQPLTAEALHDAGSRFISIDDHALRFDIAVDEFRTVAHTAYFATRGPPP